MTGASVLATIRDLLHGHGVTFREVHHPPTRTSEESSQARGEPLEIGGKAIVGKVDGVFRLFVFSAARRLRSTAVRHRLGARRFRFATREELAELTGLEPGAVPPFGPPILSLELYVDTSILENQRIAFNAGSHTDSIIMDRAAYLEIAKPADVFSFTRD